MIKFVWDWLVIYGVNCVWMVFRVLLIIGV